MDRDGGEREKSNAEIIEVLGEIRNKAVGGGWRGFPFRNRKLLRSTCRHNLSTSTVQLCKSAQAEAASNHWLWYPAEMFDVDLFPCFSVSQNNWVSSSSVFKASIQCMLCFLV